MQSFFLHMRKVLFLITVFVLGYAGLGGFDSYQYQWGFDGFSSSDETDSATYVAKYRDCIDLGDIPNGMAQKTNLHKNEPSQEFIKQGAAMAEYGKHLKATLRNLNYLDAHNHIHQEFQRSKNRLLQPGLRDSQRYYYMEIMNLCYESDKALNLGTARQL